MKEKKITKNGDNSDVNVFACIHHLFRFDGIIVLTNALGHVCYQKVYVGVSGIVQQQWRCLRCACATSQVMRM